MFILIIFFLFLICFMNIKNNYLSLMVLMNRKRRNGFAKRFICIRSLKNCKMRICKNICCQN